MDNDTYLDHIRSDGDALLAAATNLDASVPACPGWTVADLVGHIGEVHSFWAGVAARQSVDQPSREGLPEPPAEAIREWAAQQLDALLEALARTDPDTPVWTWTGPQTARWIRRRQAHETAVHRVDAELTAGEPSGIDPELAADGIDEWLRVMLPATTEPEQAPTGSMHLHTTDTDGEWTVDLSPGQVNVMDGHRQADAAARGPANDLLLMLWRRTPIEQVEVHGDADLLRALVAWPDLD